MMKTTAKIEHYEKHFGIISIEKGFISSKELIEALKVQVGKDMAPRSNFSQNTIFFVPEFENEGKRLADSLSVQVVLKPLSWPSIFDIIIVTGKKPAKIVSKSE